MATIKRYCRQDRGGCGKRLTPDRYFMCHSCEPVNSRPSEGDYDEIPGWDIGIVHVTDVKPEAKSKPKLTEKLCTLCGPIKGPLPIESFCKHKSVYGCGYRPRCRECTKPGQRARAAVAKLKKQEAKTLEKMAA